MYDQLNEEDKVRATELAEKNGLPQEIAALAVISGVDGDNSAISAVKSEIEKLSSNNAAQAAYNGRVKNLEASIIQEQENLNQAREAKNVSKCISIKNNIILLRRQLDVLLAAKM